MQSGWEEMSYESEMKAEELAIMQEHHWPIVGRDVTTEDDIDEWAKRKREMLDEKI